ncbi:helix-turn-helix domain-containing protein [Streptomyces vinaceus]|uniref:helix-turn-helix domain-containing protein n=1 Tax=Streptomyces vinaceus TaxID=1960 RepID=UPI00380B0B3E
MKRPLPDTETVKAAIDTVLEQAVAAGRRPTVTAVERHLGIPHATFHRHYHDLVEEHFLSRVPAPAQPAPTETISRRTEENLSRLQRENTDLRRTQALYEEAIRQLTVEKDALRRQGTLIPLPTGRHP